MKKNWNLKLKRRSNLIDDIANARRDRSCLTTKARNIKLVVEKCHIMLCRLLDEEPTFKHDSKLDENTWPDIIQLSNLQLDMLNANKTIKDCNDKLRKWNVID